MASPSTERMIEKHRPPAADQEKPAGSGQLWHLNNWGLLGAAYDRQMKRSLGEACLSSDRPLVISKQVAWELIAEALREGRRYDRPDRPRTTASK